MRKNSTPRYGVGARITELRVHASLSQKELAERIDIPIANIGFWERTNTPPSSKILPTLAEALDTTVEYILLGKTRTSKRTGGPTGKTKEVFEEVSSLPRRQQKKIVDVVDALIAQAKCAQ